MKPPARAAIHGTLTLDVHKPAALALVWDAFGDTTVADSAGHYCLSTPAVNRRVLVIAKYPCPFACAASWAGDSTVVTNAGSTCDSGAVELSFVLQGQPI